MNDIVFSYFQPFLYGISYKLASSNSNCLYVVRVQVPIPTLPIPTLHIPTVPIPTIHIRQNASEKAQLTLTLTLTRTQTLAQTLTPDHNRNTNPDPSPNPNPNPLNYPFRNVGNSE